MQVTNLATDLSYGFYTQGSGGLRLLVLKDLYKLTSGLLESCTGACAWQQLPARGYFLPANLTVWEFQVGTLSLHRIPRCAIPGKIIVCITRRVGMVAI